MDTNLLAKNYIAIREQTEKLIETLQPEDTVAQSMPDASPVKWHLAHTSWFFETFVLEKALPQYKNINPHYRVLFNSYYNSVGKQYLRPQRSFITRPTLAEVLEYRKIIDQDIIQLLDTVELNDALLKILEVGLHHEQQHQELILTDLKHLFAHNPLYPKLSEILPSTVTQIEEINWQIFDADLYEVGYGGGSFAFDNEKPAHKFYIEKFAIADRLVTNAEYLEFIQAKGYKDPKNWLSEGWAKACENNWSAPLYWQKIEDEWYVYTLAGLLKLRLDEPVTHISYYEADAYARWRGLRLATEQEWEIAACEKPVEGNFLDSNNFHPTPVNQKSKSQQFFGDAWEWTQSPYTAYPGFKPSKGELGEYNGKFMCGQMVLRGGSCVTPKSHIRPSYRNFFYPDARWQFSGIRLAKSL